MSVKIFRGTQMFDVVLPESTCYRLLAQNCKAYDPTDAPGRTYTG